MEYDYKVSSDNSCTLPLPVPDLSSSEHEMDVNVVHSRQCHATK